MGVVLGIGAALLASRALSSLLYGLSPADPVSFVVASVALVAAAAAASYLPAYRASRVDPLVSLRHV
jgi:putative ABC transport system permease protein